MKACMSPSFYLAVAFLGLTLWLGRAQWQAAVKRRTARAAYFDAVAGLFDRVVTQVQPSGFTRMTGHLDNLAFDIQAVPDSLTFRKLPALWGMVTLAEPLPVRATLDVMARPTGNEPFSHFATLPQSLPCPAFLPEGTAIRCDNVTLVDMDLLHSLAGIFDNVRVKELVVSPKGLRLVILAEEADRGRYLLFRDAEMGAEPLDSLRISPLLETLVTLRAKILAAQEP